MRTRRPEPLVNLVPNPSFEYAAEDGGLHRLPHPAGVYVHVNNDADLADSWASHGVRSLRISPRGVHEDTHVAPGGRDQDEAFHLGMQPGRTYTASATVFLPERLTGRLGERRLLISPGWLVGGKRTWNAADSASAPNSRGAHRLTTTFTVPEDARGAWIRFVAGARDAGDVFWDELMLTETDHAVRYFDGDSAGTALHTFDWAGQRGLSASRRILRDPRDIARVCGGSKADEARIADEIADLVGEGSTDEAEWLLTQLARHLPPAVLAFVRARRWEAAREDTRARELASEVLALDASHLGARRMLADIAYRENRYAEAVRLYRDVRDSSPGDVQAGFRLASALGRSGDKEAARVAVHTAIDVGPAAEYDARAAVDVHPDLFAERDEMARFLHANLDEIRWRAADTSNVMTLGPELPVFTMWEQGLAEAPPLVRACNASLRAFAGDAVVHTLTGSTVKHYVDVPAVIADAVRDSRTHYSDVVRLMLLQQYGGLWVDATGLLSRPLLPSTERLRENDFFCFRYAGSRVGTWFMWSRPGDYVLSVIKESLFLWFERGGTLTNYFMLHDIIEMLYWVDPRYRERWDAMDQISPRPSLRLLAELRNEFAPEQFEDLVSGSFIQKLSYKGRPSPYGSRSFESAVVRRWAAGDRSA